LSRYVDITVEREEGMERMLISRIGLPTDDDRTHDEAVSR
jgi:hypothetical protein